MKIIGGAAAHHHGLLDRVPVDMDIVDTHSYGIHIDTTLTLDIKEWPFDVYCMLGTLDRYVIPGHLYTIKMSHIFWDIKWSKHMNDILIMRKKGCAVDEGLFNMLYAYWETVHGDKSFLSLSQNKDEFFNDYVTYVYEHDYLHEVVSYYTDPLYTRVLQQGENVLIDREKFLTVLSEADRLKMIREECYVIALERWLIPSNFKIPRPKAYSLALKKMITNLSKGWFARYIVDNYHQLYKLDDHNWVELFKQRNIDNDRLYNIGTNSRAKENTHEAR